MRNLILPILALAFFFTACDKDSAVKDPENDNSVPVADVRAISEMSHDFGWKLFQETARDVADKNVLISPISVQTALSMAVNGADGETKKEMLRVLGCENCDVNDLNEQTSKLRELMEEQAGQPTLTSANGYFYDPARIEVYDAFIQLLTDSYRAGFQTHDFDDPATVDKINSWVKDNTNGKIEKIVEEIGGLDLAFLINALHFQADWSTAFDTQLTAERTFTRPDDSEVKVDFVMADRNFNTTQTENFRMVDIPFKDSTYTLSLVSPNSALASETGWLDDLSSDEVINMWGNLHYSRAIVTFPKLALEYDNGLIAALRGLGMYKAFDKSAADFSEMGRALIGPNIYISQVRHKAVLNVDEKGAEGAAVTSITFSTTSLPPEFTFDSQFVVLIRHTETNAILFAGLVNDPG